MGKSHSINRRKFLGFIGCSCGGYFLSSCGTVPITERKQLTIYPEYRINAQAANAYENFRSKTKLINTGSQLKEIKDIGKKMEFAVSTFFENHMTCLQLSRVCNTGIYINIKVIKYFSSCPILFDVLWFTLHS